MSDERCNPCANHITAEDVFGKFTTDFQILTEGMIVARHEDTCPIWKDVLGYKTYTFICLHSPEVLTQVENILIFVFGGGCVEKRKRIDGDKIAIRASYQCW